tara:strand:- start:44830 stop:46575 length:1746 start_codon:yes stop_codon:yes gene_type:complete
MCGIAGQINLNKSLNKNLLINKSLSHRGPHNHNAIRLKKNLILYHTRLKIIDLSDGSNQPMSSQNSRFTIIYNGELYNFKEIRKELEKKGHVFVTTGDTEVFLNGFIEFGLGFFKKVNGIFAISIYDKRLNCIYFARDFIGVKPLYYTIDNKGFNFSSELKTLVKIQKTKCKLNEKVLNEFLFYKYIVGKETLVKNIYKFDPGKIYKIDLNKKDIKLQKFNYYNFIEKKCDDSLNRAKSNFKDLFTKSINLQLQSDANLGVQLSGGIDSTLITEFALKQKKIENLFFSFFKNFKKDEFKYAKYVSNKLKLKFEKIGHTKNFFDNNLKKSIYHLDEPLNHPHSVAIFQISKIAQKKVSVLLTGEGADEIFFGYERYRNILNKKINDLDLIKNGAFLRSKKDLELFEKFRSGKFGDPHRNRLNLLNKIDVDNRIKKFQVFETQSHLQSLLLRSDKMMMANSIEARVPFLDKDTYNYTLNLSDNIKKNSNQKLILKKILLEEGYSSKFVNRKKIGYIVPFNDWIIKKLKFKKELINENLLNLFDKKELENLSIQLENNKNIYSNAKMYWLLKNLSEFIDIFELN